MKPEEENNNEFSRAYSDQQFWGKLEKYASTAGRELVFLALKLYFALQKPGVPLWVKTAIVGALGYFISPIDAIPDLIPIAGYTDDLGVLVFALAKLSTYIDNEVVSKAEEKVKQWFG